MKLCSNDNHYTTDNVDGVFIVILGERDVETGENKVLKMLERKLVA